MDERDMESLLLSALMGVPYNDNEVVDVEAFEAAGVVSRYSVAKGFVEASGVVVIMADEEEFHLTINQHISARPEEGEGGE